MSLEGAGGCRFWGFSPATNLLDEAPPRADDDPPDAPLRTLLVAVSDVRHMLSTVAAAARLAHETGSPQRAIEFAVFEREPEVLARHLLLLAIALDFELPRRERAELLLEVWANAQLREKTATYVAVKGVQIGRAIAHEEGPLASLIDISSLKSRDRDNLEQVLRTWYEEVDFDVVKLRDERLRRYYGARYDARKNVLEWDYSMELSEIASIVHKIHFREWRMTGLAFEVRDSSYSAPNRTLASMAYGRQAGRSIMKRGFWCDVANGPWVACGVECENGEERLTKKRSDRHFKSSCDIAYYNTLSYLQSLETGTSFAIKQEDIEDFEYGGSVASGGLSKGFLNGGGGGGKLGAVVEEVEAGAGVEDAAEAAADAKRAAEMRAKVVAAKMAKLPKFKLKLLGGDWLDVQKKPRHQRAFDVCCIGTHFAFVMGSERLNGLLRPRAHVLLETAKFLVETRKAQRSEYCEKLVGVAMRLGWTLRDEAHTPNGCADPLVRFEYDEETAPALAEAARAKLEASQPGGAVAAAKELMPPSADSGELGCEPPAVDVSDDGRAAAAAQGGKADAAASAMLQIAEGGGKTDGGDESAAPAQAPAAAPVDVKLTNGTAAAMGVGVGKLCAITGKPAKYRDPISGLPYADLAAFRELRKLHPDPKAAEKEAAKAAADKAAEEAKARAQKATSGDDGGKGGEAGGDEEGVEGEGDEIKPIVPVPSDRPIQFGNGFARRVNKVA